MLYSRHGFGADFRSGFALVFAAIGCGSSETGDSADGGAGKAAGSTGGSSGASSGGSSGSSTGGASMGGSSGSGGPAGSGGLTGSAGTGGSAEAGDVECVGNQPRFPTFERACTSSESCTIAIHQVDCCGNRVATGIHDSERARFDAAEQLCQSQYPACGCPQGPTATDTGQQVTDETEIEVECRDSVCTTFVP